MNTGNRFKKILSMGCYIDSTIAIGYTDGSIEIFTKKRGKVCVSCSSYLFKIYQDIFFTIYVLVYLNAVC